MPNNSNPPPPKRYLPLESLIESLLFVASEPVPIARLAAALELRPKQVEKAIGALQESYQSRGIRLQRYDDQVQLTTAPESATVLEHFLGLQSQQRLSQAALETLAVVAYQQPITRPQVDAIRGVNSDAVLRSLLYKGLVDDIGRSDGPGRPILYGTTAGFLQHFGLTSLQELPPLDLDEVDHPFNAI